MRSLLFALIALAGCAQAGKQSIGGRPDGSIQVIDSSTQRDAFVPLIDAPPVMQSKTLTETTSDTLVQGTAPACGNTSTGITNANNYYRVFTLSDFGITTDFHVTQVTFQVDTSTGQTASVKIGTYNGTPGGTLSVSNMTTVTMKNATVPSTTTGATVTTDFTGTTIPAGKKLLMEIDSPAGGKFYMGANTAGESASGYMMAPVCSVNSPTDANLIAANYPVVHLLMTVTGTY